MTDITPPMWAKIHCLASGVSFSHAARAELIRLRGANRPLSVQEFCTTGGLTFKLEGAGYVNAPYLGAFAKHPAFEIDFGETGFDLCRKASDERYAIDILPLPAYIKPDGTWPYQGAMITHVDRVRLSPVKGCSFSCKCCDLNLEKYTIHEKSLLMNALRLAKADAALPARHALISGGTPHVKDRAQVDEIYEHILRRADMLVDIMLTPRRDDRGLFGRLYRWGANAFSINLEMFGSGREDAFPQKAALGLAEYGRAIDACVELTEGRGRVRSLLIVGLEDKRTTLKGVEWIAERGAYPVLSPFRPADKTVLAFHPLPSAEYLAEIWQRSSEIADRYGVKIGPPCEKCQHNDLSFPHVG